MHGFLRLGLPAGYGSSKAHWRWLEWVSVLVSVSFFLGYFFLMIGPGHGFFHSVSGIIVLVALVVLFSRLIFGAIGRLQRDVQTLSQQVAEQNVQLRALHQANLALSQERVSDSVMQRVADLGCQLFQARSAVLTVVGPRGETEARYCSPEGPGICVPTGVVRMVEQRTEPLRFRVAEKASSCRRPAMTHRPPQTASWRPWSTSKPR